MKLKVINTKNFHFGLMARAGTSKTGEPKKVNLRLDDTLEIICFNASESLMHVFCKRLDATLVFWPSRIGTDFEIVNPNYNKYWAELNE